MSRPGVGAMVVVVPVRDEAALLRGCLSSLATAIEVASRAGLRCEVRVVLDACTDGSGEVARAFGFPTLISAAGRVGAARALGVSDALRSLDDTRVERVWIANTDADSRVPSGWLTHQLALSRIADVCVGTVRPDFDDLSDMHRTHWLSTHTKGRPNGHVHGANLGVRASTYLDAGGFAPMGEHEDVDLVARCRSIGAVVVASDEAEVVTSGRFVGRTPGGYAGYLRRQGRELSAEGRRRGSPRP